MAANMYRVGGRYTTVGLPGAGAGAVPGGESPLAGLRDRGRAAAAPSGTGARSSKGIGSEYLGSTSGQAASVGS